MEGPGWGGREGGRRGRCVCSGVRGWGCARICGGGCLSALE